MRWDKSAHSFKVCSIRVFHGIYIIGRLYEYSDLADLYEIIYNII